MFPFDDVIMINNVTRTIVFPTAGFPAIDRDHIYRLTYEDMDDNPLPAEIPIIIMQPPATSPASFSKAGVGNIEIYIKATTYSAFVSMQYGIFVIFCYRVYLCTIHNLYDTQKIKTWNPWQQGSWGQHGVHRGPTGPRWAPCWPHEPCYLGCFWRCLGPLSLTTIN